MGIGEGAGMGRGAVAGMGRGAGGGMGRGEGAGRGSGGVPLPVHSLKLVTNQSSFHLQRQLCIFN